MKKNIEKIALGTVQFGLDYGIKNQSGQVNSQEVADILEYCAETGISCLDTAYAYGESESVLGKYFSYTQDTFSVISKYPKEPDSSFEKIFSESLKRLNRTSLYGYLIHNFETYEQFPQIYEHMLRAKKDGCIQKTGFSVYFPAEIEKLLDSSVNFDLVQLPYNILDQRFEPLFHRLKERNVEIHVRSIFLQGLLLIPPENLAPRFQEISSKITAIQQTASEIDISAVHLCLGFGLLNPYIDKIVIGVDSLSNLKENLHVFNYLNKIESVFPRIKSLHENDNNIILPFNWTKF